jgi:glycosyltransferase involved in cell wall biosynthesis
MMKNEEASLERTLASVFSLARRKIRGGLFVLDTGSTDASVQTCRDIAQRLDIHPFQLRQTQFVNFEVSRNEALAFARHCVSGDSDENSFALLLDANDELTTTGGSGETTITIEDDIDCGGAPPRAAASGYYLNQKWRYSDNHTHTYFNIKLVNLAFEWRYSGVVHEVIQLPAAPAVVERLAPSSYHIAQDRQLDSARTSRTRYINDERMLRDYLDAHGYTDETARNVFYYAQTLECLGLYEQAKEIYKIRIELKGFFEERFESMMRLGSLFLSKNVHEQVHWFMRAYAFDRVRGVEPLVKLARLMDEVFNDRVMAYVYILAATAAAAAASTAPPPNRTLFLNEDVYVYDRWHLLGRYAYYVRDQFPNAIASGTLGCRTAIAARNRSIDVTNLQFYMPAKDEPNKRYYVNSFSKALAAAYK